MPKPPLRQPFATLAEELIEAMKDGSSQQRPFTTMFSNLMKSMLDGLHAWRPDLQSPESYSDMMALCIGILARFEVKGRKTPLSLSEMTAYASPDETVDPQISRDADGFYSVTFKLRQNDGTRSFDAAVPRIETENLEAHDAPMSEGITSE